MTYGSSDSSTITYEYDNALRPAEYDATSSVLSGGYVRRATYEYFKDGAVKKVSNLLDSGLDQNYKFDQVGRLVSSISGQKLNNEEEMEEPHTQAIAYNAFGDMTSRYSEIWGVERSFDAAYTNRRKTGGNEVYDKTGNLVDKTLASNKYDRWRFDAAGRNHESIMRWYRSVPSPTHDSTQTILKIYDGDGLDVKRVDTNDWFSTFPTSTSGTITSSEFYIRSSVLGGQIITKLDETAEKKVTFVYAGSGIIAEQRVIWDTPGVYWRHEDVVSGSYSKMNASGSYGGHDDDSPTNVEYEPLGSSIETSDPNWDDIINPGGMLQFKFAGDANRPEDGCLWNGSPFPCTSLHHILPNREPASRNTTTIYVNTRAEGGFGLYSSLSAMVSTWRYSVRQLVDEEDVRLQRGHYGDSGNWHGDRYGLLVGVFYAQFLSDFAETLISRQDDKIAAEKLPLGTEITPRRKTCIFNINLTVPKEWRGTDTRTVRTDQFGEITEYGILRRLKDQMRKIFEEAGAFLVFDDPRAAAGTQGGNYNLAIQEGFTGRHYGVRVATRLARISPLGISIGNDGQVSTKYTGLDPNDLGFVGAHESFHHFMKKLYPGINEHSDGNDIMRPGYSLGSHINGPNFSDEQRRALSDKCN